MKLSKKTRRPACSIGRCCGAKCFFDTIKLTVAPLSVHGNSSQLSHPLTLQNQPFKRTHMTIFIYKGNNFIWPATTCIVDV